MVLRNRRAESAALSSLTQNESGEFVSQKDARPTKAMLLLLPNFCRHYSVSCLAGQFCCTWWSVLISLGTPAYVLKLKILCFGVSRGINRTHPNCVLFMTG